MSQNFDHGDSVRIVYDDGYGWDATVLTTENIGFGPALRVERDSDGEQLHVHCDRDVTVKRRHNR